MDKKSYLLVFALIISMALIAPQGTLAQDPIKIGFLAPLAGSRAQVGKDMAAGWEMALKEANYTAGGRTIEFIAEDEGTPNLAVTKARKLIDHDKVALAGGIFSSSVAYAVAPVFTEANVPFIITGTNANDVTQRKASKAVIRVNAAGSQVCHVAGDYAYNHLGWKKVTIIGWEHAFGQESISAFLRVFEEAGGQVIQRIYVPRKTLDFGPYVSNISKEADGVFAVITASPAMRFFRALNATGYMKKRQVLTVLTATDESFLQEIGNITEGVMSVNAWSPSLDTPESTGYVAKAMEMTGRPVTTPMMDAYVGGKWALAAIEKVNGNVEDKEAFMKALWSVKLDSTPHGPLSLDKYGCPVQNMYIRKVEKKGDTYQNSVIYTYKGVSQFWKYDSEKYLNDPPYGKDFPPCNNCK